MRRRLLIAYDVSDDRRRTRVFQMLKDHGEHAQFSVFLCELSRRELAELRSLLVEAIHDDEDQVLILDLGRQQHPLESRMECLGKPYDPVPRCMIV